MGVHVRRGVQLAAWWAALTAVWVAAGSSLAPAALLIGAGCAVLGSVAAVAAQRTVVGGWRPNAGFLRWLPPLILAVPADTLRLLPLLAAGASRREQSGGQLRQAPPESREPAESAAFRRAVGALAVSMTPGTVVVDWPPDGRPALIHHLCSGRPSLTTAVMR